MPSLLQLDECAEYSMEVSKPEARTVGGSVASFHGHDVFIRMATGAGKSLCMFLAPLAARENGIGVVISPLNSLPTNDAVWRHEINVPV